MSIQSYGTILSHATAANAHSTAHTIHRRYRSERAHIGHASASMGYIEDKTAVDDDPLQRCRRPQVYRTVSNEALAVARRLEARTPRRSPTQNGT